MSQSVENSVKIRIFKKFHINFVEGFLVDLKTFLGWLCLSNPGHKVNIKLIFG